MKIRLGNTQINYITTEQASDSMVFAEVVDSGMSYESPILIRTVEELEGLFGNAFSDYSYLRELINNNITLYLYKPITTETLSQSYTYDTTLYPDVDSLPQTPDPRKIYFVGTSEKNYQYTWLDNSWVLYSDIPNEYKVNSKSRENRDRIRISNNDSTAPGLIDFCYPDYRELTIEEEFTGNTYHLGNFNYTIPTDYSCITGSDGELFRSGDYTLCFTITFQDITQPLDGYIVFDNHLFYTSGIDPNSITIVSDTPADMPYCVSDGNELLIALRSKGIRIETTDTPETYKLFFSYPVKVTNYYDMNGLVTITPDYDYTQAILTDSILDSDINLDLWSKTIGTSLYSELKVVINKTSSTGDYRFTITRGPLEEIIEGKINPEPGEDRLDDKINKTSKLVYCNFHNLGYELREGTYILSGATEEIYTSDCYYKSFQEICNTEGQYFDFFLVPDTSKYHNGILLDGYYMDYKLYFYNQAVLKNTQVLIQNYTPYTLQEVTDITSIPNITSGVVYTDGTNYKVLSGQLIVDATQEQIGCAISGGDYAWNYLDPDNRLVYFYKSIKVGSNTFPGYYVFINNIINNTLSLSNSTVIPEIPSTTTTLETKRCNYLSKNNYTYYYNTIFGSEEKTHVLLRFVLSRCSRVLYNLKGQLVGLKNEIEIKNIITTGLRNIQTDFSAIVDSIDNINVNVNLQSNKATVTFNTTVSNILTEDIHLDITLNTNN